LLAGFDLLGCQLFHTPDFNTSKDFDYWFGFHALASGTLDALNGILSLQFWHNGQNCRWFFCLLSCRSREYPPRQTSAN
jgi:hypothetical protein